MDNWVICARCGAQWEVAKPKRRKSRTLCESCRTRRASVVNSEKGKCIPWHGEFDSDWITPVDDDGKLYLPGIRLCGNADCVNLDHIEKF